MDWTSSLTYARAFHTATLLSNGNVLVAGGYGISGNTLKSAELYNATTGLWTVTGNLTYARDGHTATLLPNGNLLVAGGTTDYVNGLNSAEFYNPSTGVWTVTGNLTYARQSHTATLLYNGNLLIAGGQGKTGSYLNSAELYNATTGVWTMTGNLTYARYQHSATLLPNGNVLVAAGFDNNGGITAELYIPTVVWTVTGSLTYARKVHTASLLPNGDVLVAGGYGTTAVLNSTELYNATTDVWTVTGSLTYARELHTATLLSNGNVLVAGGAMNNVIGLNSAELYNANATRTPTATPATLISTPTPTPTSPVTTVCSSLQSGATTGFASFNVTSANTTAIGFCSAGLTGSPTLYCGVDGNWNLDSLSGSCVTAASSSNAGAIAGGIVGGVVGLALLVLLLLCFLRSRYWNKTDMNNSDYKNPMITMSSSKSERSSQISDARLSDDIYISFNSLKLGAVLGQGHFGQVYQANYTGAQVAVKKSKGIEKLILEEAKMMKNLPPHPNVLHYYGVSQDNGEFMMVTELCDKGNLVQFLRNPQNDLTSQQCRQFCCQIASGMWHISKYGIIHRDLRAENILLSGDNKLVAKVADFGLARSLNSHDQKDSGYYRMTELKEIPISWTPPEVLNQSDQLKYVAASDVWSFGVVIWEIYSKGAKPFEATPVHAVIAMIRDPIRNVPLLPRPNDCPDDIFAIMNSCWAFNPQDRPTFEQLYNQLS